MKRQYRVRWIALGPRGGKHQRISGTLDTMDQARGYANAITNAWHVEIQFKFENRWIAA